MSDLPDYRYNGPEYVPERDNERLDTQLGRVKTCMADGDWRTLQQIADATGDPVASISAQLRHLRKRRFGSHVVERRHLGNGLFTYRVMPPPDPEPEPKRVPNLEERETLF